MLRQKDREKGANIINKLDGVQRSLVGEIIDRFEEVDAREAQPRSEDKGLKDRLFRGFGSHISTWKHVLKAF